MTYGLRDLDGGRIELCDECGFDTREPRDLGASLAAAHASLERLAEHPDAGRRPAEETWSGREYAEHCVEVTAETLQLCRRAAGLPEPASSPATLAEAATATAAVVVGVSTDRTWDAVTDGWPFEVTVRGAMVHLLHDLEHHVLDVRRGYARLALAQGVEVVTSRAGA